jgi:hypothetical protein
MRRVARSVLIFDQGLRLTRRVNRCRKHVSSCLAFCPSIHPKHNASSTASL